MREGRADQAESQDRLVLREHGGHQRHAVNDLKDKTDEDEQEGIMHLVGLARTRAGVPRAAERLGVAGRSRSTRTLTYPILAPFDTARPAAIGGEPMAAGL